MAYDNSPDSEFDPEMERILREHFDAEDSNLRAPNDPWPRLESRMEEPAMASFFSRLLGFLNPMRGGRLSPAFAVAGVAVIAVAVAAVVWAASGDGGPEAPAGLVAVPATEAPLPTAAPSATEAPAALAAAPGVTALPPPRRVEATTEVASRRAEPTAAPAATAAMAQAPAEVEVAKIVEEQAESASLAAVQTATPAAPGATAMPYATAAPAATPAMAAEAAMMEPEPQPQGAARTPPDTTFRDYQRQPFVEASEDNVSTFSLDTDRTSYHLALGWARSGYEVNPDSVRAEEWLNAFNYQYDPPSSSGEFAIVGDLYPHPLDDGKLLARIAFQAPELVDGKPLNVTLVLDASGSMADGNRVDIARAAAESIRRSLRADDRIAVVHFTDDVIDRYTVAHRRPDEPRVRNSINLLQPHGSTNVQAGLNLGVSMADHARDLRPDAHNYVILMSDGVANVDATNPFTILETAHDPDAGNPLRLITVGVGINNYNDYLLEQLAQHGNGWYRYLDSTGQAQATFSRDNWLALSTPFADQTRAQVTWNTGTVARWRIIGYENRVTPDETFTQDRKEFAEIYSGAATTVLYELELSETAQSLSSVPLGRVELRWVDPATGDSRSQSATLTGSPGVGFGGHEGALAHLGAIVALSADRYGVLPLAPDAAYPEVHTSLSALLDQLRSLRGDLGTLDAYNDFLFLLEHITGRVEELVQSSPPSGYSR